MSIALPMHLLTAASVACAATAASALVPLATSRYRGVEVFDGDAIRSVKQLREVFDERFASPRESHPDRFSWDPWHVTRRAEDAPTARVAAAPEAVSVETDSIEEAVAAAGRAERGAAADDDRTSGEGSGLQYSMLRTPAAAYFPEELFEEFCEELAAFGQTHLGCDAFTPPWLACYTDGHEMAWHSDASHGPFAFVVNLTPNGCHARAESEKPGFFEGGETVLLRPEILDYWRGFDGSRGLEADSIIERVDPAPFGRVVCFDGRVPHSVSRVRGTRDPRRGRLVLTGWFSAPRPSAVGGLAEDGAPSEEAAAVLDAALAVAYDAMDELELARVAGFLGVRVAVTAAGVVQSVDAVCDTLRVDSGEQRPLDDDEVSDDVSTRELIAAALGEAAFPAAASATTFTLPLVFD